MRPAGHVHGARVPAVATVDGAIHQRGPLGGPAFELPKAALGLHPAQYLAHHVDGEHGGRVGHRVVGLVRGVVEVRGEVPPVAGQAVPPHHDDGQAGRTQVLLGAAVDQVVDVPVDRPAEEVGAHVRHQRHVDRGQVRQPDSADGLVGRHVEVRGIAAYLDLVSGRHAHERLAGSRPCLVDGGDLHGIAEGLAAPRAGVEVAGGLALGQQVHRDLGELQRGSTLQEQDGEVVGDGCQRAEVGEGVHVHGVVGGGTVAALDDRHAGAVEVEELVPYLLEDRNRKGARARAEVVYTAGRGHGASPSFEPGPALSGRRGRR